MSDPAYTLTRFDGEALQVELRGDLTDGAMLELEHALRSRLSETPADSLRVLVDLRAVSDYDMKAREVLVRSLSHLARKARRLVYVAEHGCARALALWVSRIATPGKSQVVDDAGRARRWLTPAHSGVHPVEDAPAPAARRPADA